MNKMNTGKLAILQRFRNAFRIPNNEKSGKRTEWWLNQLKKVTFSTRY